MRTITTKELIAANRKALADGTLIALAIEQGNLDLNAFVDNDPCVYRHDGTFSCAIGCALTDSELWGIDEAGLNSGANATALPGVRFEDPAFALALQTKHDNWAVNPNNRTEFELFLASEEDA